MEYFHSVRLDRDKCKGCTNCIKRCPTEAIRVRDGKAQIIEERCIDCGECIRVCPNHAKIAVGDSLEAIYNFSYVVALPAPSFYSQFQASGGIPQILGALLKIGFNAVFEVALAAEAVSWATRKLLQDLDRPRPMISAACPAVVSLIQVRFPSLINHVVPVEPPVNVAARLARLEATTRTGLPPENIGVFFLSPCPAKITAVRQTQGAGERLIDGVIPILSIYGQVREALKEAKSLEAQAGAYGVGWGRSGGENAALGYGKLLEVDGIHHVIEVLEAMEKGQLEPFDYLEAQACPGGCVGGALMVSNPYEAKRRLGELLQALPKQKVEEKILADMAARGSWWREKDLEPRPALRLDEDIASALLKMQRLEETVKLLPGLDCGACGSPNCRALAEDIVRGYAVDTDCIFLLRERVRVLAEEVAELARKLPPSMAEPERSRDLP
ncbi:Iron only hydrogenase large subunit, C-terminal domain [Thermanaeromonas toyohensis ToBE]|uniref:Iron only hydrogenase large subunit, C-terminal domain n=1 Tax=Thermanaeromonas toyohensis ToBE TaxID=698762 RepID=A0A1W1VZY5_9FIRM|nr:[Fe-Fe] hydrogenase large subunit C-terminal domain-containing protein [Thermanaeromonas toyohensis]SMB98929.1 Iron only hydrogenase large subunit, C-terminal domain [Thermanaeromonas toyohensis ToBE]